MEVGGVVSFASGAMESLLAKLQSIADRTTDTKTKGLGSAITMLKDELELIRSNLQNFELMRERTLQTKQWMKQVRETVYDIEDWVDDHQHRADREAGDKHFGIIKGLVQMVKNLGAKDQLPSTQIKEFKVLIHDANERLKRYGLKRESSLTSNQRSGVGAADDNSVPALRAEETTDLVGMDAPVKNVLGQLGHDKGPHLKVIFLVGSGGLGKTTLAKQVWRSPRLQQQFELLAFVHAGRNSSVKTVLMSILDQVIINWQRPRGYESWNEQDVINELKGQLGGKRYLIVIDDVWSSARWQVMKCALPSDDDKGSRVIITTHKGDMAASSCMEYSYVHEMKPLRTFDDQKELFLGRSLDLGKGFTGELAGLTDEMLKRCGGVPLAIIVLAGIMAGNRDKTESQLRSVCMSIIQDLEQVGEADALSKILYLSYADLPNYLKSCFLYLSVFPQGYVMRKDRVVRRWIAEGFIGAGSRGSSQETGESCFNELITRGLIQPLPAQDNGERGYVVHESVRELIMSLLDEENFVTVSPQLVHAVPHDKIRRLCLQYNDRLEVKPTMPSSGALSSVRSLTVFGRDELGKHDPGNFRFLRVLDLEDADTEEKGQLQNIHKLFQLKYLGLGGGVSAALPKQIGELENLETLDIRRTRVRQLTVDDGGFRRLAHLLVAGVQLPSGVGKLKELQELSMVDVSKSSAAVVQSVRDLGELLKLRILGLKWGIKRGDKDCAACEQSLVEALKKLGMLQHLCLDADNDCSLDFLVESWRPSINLREFKLACSHFYFPHVPKPMAEAPVLTYLEIGVAAVSKEDLDILRGLPALIILKLRSGASGDDDKQRVVIGGQGFPVLQVFWFERRDGAITGLVFKEGAMPMLRKLRLRCKYNALGLGDAPAGRPVIGLGNLRNLKQVHVKMDLGGVANPDVEAAEVAITQAANVPSTTCRLEITV